MRKLFSNAIIAIIVILFSCTINGDLNLDKHPPCSAGNCDIITEERVLPSFTEINHNFVGNVNISQGAEFKVIVHGESFLVDNTRIVVSNEILHIEFIENYHDLSDRLITEVTIIAPDINAIYLNGVGDVRTLNTLMVSKLMVRLAGVGNLNADVETDEITVMHSGVGSTNLSGTTNIFNVFFSGVGELNSFDLISNICDIVLNSVGTCNVQVLDELTVNITSVGTVNYKGDPEVTSYISTLGKLVKVE